MSNNKQLTPAQMRVLRELPFDVGMWANRPLGGWPVGVNGRALRALERKGLVTKTRIKHRPFAVRYTRATAQVE